MKNNTLWKKVEGFTLAAEGRKMGIYPFFRQVVSEMDTEVFLKDGQKVLMMGSNSYMGLTNHPEVKDAAIKALTKYGSCSAGSRFLNGTLDIHEELEAELATWVGKEAAMVFSTGFQVNQGVIATLLGRRDHVIMDKLNHASIIDAAILSQAHSHRFPHNDAARFKTVLEGLPEDGGRLLVTEGVFSMDGDITRLPELVGLAEQFDTSIMVDDAHGLGVLGPQGSGTSAHFGLTDRVDLIMGTFSKSLASIGGFIAADDQTIEFLKHHARAFIFSASMPAANAAAALTAVRIIKREPERLEKLWQNTAMMRDGLQQLGFNTGRSETPIIPVLVGEVFTLARMTIMLQKEGVFVNPVMPPAVPPTDTLLRISMMATHTPTQIEFALEKLAKVGKELGIIQE